MARVPYQVSVVLDRDFGSRIRELLEAGPVWVVDSPTNRDSAQKLWAEFPKRTQLDGITVFKSEASDPVEMLIAEMPTIDLHHGVYSAEHSYTSVRVIGCELKTEVRESLEEFGFNFFSRTDKGFDATRPLPPP